MALDAGILDNTQVAAKAIEGGHATRSVALVWRRASPRDRDFRLLAALLADAGKAA
jgi:LysR family hydrogen peroxide-inducible transcriptional activator